MDHGSGPSNKQRKPSGNEMDNKVVTLAKELKLPKKVSKVNAQLKDPGQKWHWLWRSTKSQRIETAHSNEDFQGYCTKTEIGCIRIEG